MFHLTFPSLVAVAAFALLLVGESYSFPRQETLQQVIKNELEPSEIALSLVVNQMAVLRLLNESSSSYASRERELQEMRDLRLDLDEEREQLKNDLQDTKESALQHLNTLKEAIVNETNIKNQETRQLLNNLYEASADTLEQQDERQQQKLLALDEKARELESKLHRSKETIVNELQNIKATILRELNTEKEEAIQGLRDLKEETVNVAETALQQAGRKRFMKYDIKFNQTQALGACEQMNGRLALPKNKEEEMEINRVIGVIPAESKYKRYWMCGTDEAQEGTWVHCVTGKPMTYSNFASNEPNNAHAGEHCLEKVVFSAHPAYRGWNDQDCSDVFDGFVCEFTD